MTKGDKVLVILFRYLLGIGSLFALVPVFMPMSWMAATHRWRAGPRGAGRNHGKRPGAPARPPTSGLPREPVLEVGETPHVAPVPALRSRGTRPR